MFTTNVITLHFLSSTWLNGDVPRLPSSGTYVSQFVRFPSGGLAFWIFILKIFKSLKTIDTGSRISQASKTFRKFLRLYLSFYPNLVKYLFKNVSLKEFLIWSSTVIEFTN